MAKFARLAHLSHRFELEVIRTETRALLAQFQRYSAYATAQTAFGRIYNSLGLDVLPEDISGNSNLEQLSRDWRKAWGNSERQTFNAAIGDRPSQQPFVGTTGIRR